MKLAGQFPKTPLRLTPRRRDELTALRDFFRTYFGPHYDTHLQLRVGTYRQQISRVLFGHAPLSRTLLPRLRLLRIDIENRLAGHS